ncbi:unnamed protein product, partial [Brachionus calyciflorus]
GCNQQFFQFCMNGKTDMFQEDHFVFKEFSDNCKNRFNITPIENSFQTSYASIHDEYKSFSNIIFSNGLWDPYWTSGIYKFVNEKLPVILIEEAAHHADLLEPNENDPESLRKARLEEERIILKWIKDFNHAKLTRKFLKRK